MKISTRSAKKYSAVFPAILAVFPLAGTGQGDEKDAATREVGPSEPFDSRRLLLTAPFAVPRPNFFHAALEVPPLEPGRTLDPGSLYFRLRTAHGRSNEERTMGGFKQDFDGTYHEWAQLEAAWGAWARLELGARAVVAGWDEHVDRFELLDDRGRPLVRFEDQTLLGMGASRRHENLSVVGVKAKGMLLRAEEDGLDLSLALSAKFPAGRPRDLTHAGTYDVALTALGSIPFSWGALHANWGVTAPLGEQNLFIDEARIDLNPFVHGGLGITFSLPWDLAAGVQLEANTSAFSEVPFLAGPPLNFIGGVRKLFGGLVLEAGGGTGVNWENSYQVLVFVSAGYLFY
ncbi:MAG: hypothetical protein HY717_12530 [Planctomycetes bacterium]|nr:hypothetical protein [Planctomycetota bacterium]